MSDPNLIPTVDEFESAVRSLDEPNRRALLATVIKMNAAKRRGEAADEATLTRWFDEALTRQMWPYAEGTT